MKFVGGVFSLRGGRRRTKTAPWCDWWLIEDLQYPLTRLSAAAGYPRDEITVSPITMDDMRKGCWDPKARLEDMDVNHVEASLAFPSFPRFCGQTFIERKDKELADLCVKAYNDWMFDEWCAGTNGRLIPLIIVQLWDPKLAAAEIRRNAARGCHAVTFSEIPPFLGLPSIHDKDGYWDPFFAGVRGDRHRHLHAHRLVVEDAVDVGRRAGRGRLDAHVHERGDVAHRLADVGHVRALPAARRSRTARARSAGSRTSSSAPTRCGRTTAAGAASPTRCKRPPSEYYYEHVYGCFFDDPHGLKILDSGRRRQHHVRDRLPAHRLDVAAHQEGRGGDHEGSHAGAGRQDLPQQRDQDVVAGSPSLSART